MMQMLSEQEPKRSALIEIISESGAFPREITRHWNSNDFELKGIESELVKKYRPKFLGRGGEHIIYEIPDHPNVVVKVPTELTKRIISWNVEHGLSIDSLPDKIELHAREIIKQESRRYGQLKKYFGEGHVLGQRKILIKLPITDRVLNFLYDGKPPIKGSEVWSVAMIQKRAEELNDPEHLALVSGYAEQRELNPEDWNRVTEHLVFGKNPEDPLSQNDFLTVQSHDNLRALLERAEGNKDLKRLLSELVKKSISYTEGTGEMLDLIGPDNIVFSEKNGKWTYRLVDALYPADKKMMEELEIAMRKISAETELDDHDRSVLMNAFNYVRTINGLAEQLGIQERVNIIPGGVKQDAADFQKIIREHLTFYQD